MLELQNISYQVDEEGKDKEIIKKMYDRPYDVDNVE